MWQDMARYKRAQGDMSAVPQPAGPLESAFMGAASNMMQDAFTPEVPYAKEQQMAGEGVLRPEFHGGSDMNAKIMQAVMGEQQMNKLKAPKLTQSELKEKIMRDEVSTTAASPSQDRMPANAPIPPKFAAKYQKEEDKSYAEMVRGYMKKQEELAKNAQDRAKILGQGFNQQVDLSSLNNFVDNMHGTNISAGYKAPETWEQRNATIQGYENQAQKTNAGLTDDAMNMLRTKLLDKQIMSKNNRSNQGLQLTEAEKYADREFGKQYANNFAAGKIEDKRKIVNQLNGVINELRSTPNDQTGGGMFNVLPDGVTIFTHPEETDIRERVEDVVQRNLREVLGAQFTEQEGARLIKRAYNPALSEETNLARLERLAGAAEDALMAEQRAGEHFERYGTIKGYKGSRSRDIAIGLRDEFNLDSDEWSGEEDSAAVKWAKENPTDERAAQILQLNGA